MLGYVYKRHKKKCGWQDSLKSELYQAFKEEQIQILLKFFPRIEAEGTLSNSFYEATDTLIPKPHKTQKRERTADQFHS